jgi:hypothetical protein
MHIIVLRCPKRTIMANLLNRERSHLLDASGAAKNDILSELQTVLDSSTFRTSLRAREFLSFVVHQVIDGDGDSLKERSIGVHLYHRPPTYMTGEDPVVRVKAGEVRRRLARYYAENAEPAVSIELPTGSYVPQFRRRPEPISELIPEPSPVETHSEESPIPVRKIPRTSTVRHSWPYGLRIPLICSVLAVGVVIAYAVHRSKSPAQQLWEPLLTPRRIVLLCVPSPVGYALSSELSRQLGPSHFPANGLQFAMNTTPIVLDPETTLKAKEITPLVDYYVNKGDAYVMSEVSRFFARTGEDDQLRIGKTSPSRNCGVRPRS